MSQNLYFQCRLNRSNAVDPHLLARRAAQRRDEGLTRGERRRIDIQHHSVIYVLRRIVAEGRTVVVVLHDLNQAFRHADHLVVMKDGRVQGCGTPETIAAPAFLHDVFGIDCAIHPDPEAAPPMAVIKADPEAWHWRLI